MFCVDLLTGIKYRVAVCAVNSRRIKNLYDDDSFWFTLKEFNRYFKLVH